MSYHWIDFAGTIHNLGAITEPMDQIVHLVQHPHCLFQSKFRNFVRHNLLAGVVENEYPGVLIVSFRPCATLVPIGSMYAAM